MPQSESRTPGSPGARLVFQLSDKCERWREDLEVLSVVIARESERSSKHRRIK
jgi:hypothetical protein